MRTGLTILGVGCVLGACLALALLVPRLVRGPIRPGPADAMQSAARDAGELAPPEMGEPSDPGAPPAPGTVDWSDAPSAFEVALVAAGVSPGDAPWLRERFEATERQRQALRSLARSRTLTPDEQAQLDGLDAALEREVGSDAYDRLLYAQGENNRVRVIGVGPGGPASQAGLLPGDVLLRYDGKRIYGLHEFRDAVDAAEAARGDGVVEIEVLRGGTPFAGVIQVGRPHMGLQPTRVKP